MKKDKWIWMPHAGHLIVGHQCQFKLNTYVGEYIVSTVGEYMPDSAVREILAESRKMFLKGKGDEREADWLKKNNGFETIGCDRKYETMVFKAVKSTYKCCPYKINVSKEMDMQGYNTPEDAYKSHLELCDKWSKK